MNINAYISDMIYLESPDAISMIEHPFFAAVKKDLTHWNPQYDTLERLGKWTGATEKYVRMWNQATKDGRHFLAVPRGYLVKLQEREAAREIELNWCDRTVCPDLAEPFPMPTGRLDDFQEDAVAEMLKFHQGCLQAPTGSGKTNMLLSLIPYIQTPTLILVHTKELLAQTRQRCQEWLGVEAGVLGGGKSKLSEITVGMIQTLARMDIKESGIGSRFGAAFVDECFSAGTLIDGRCIETVKVGDMVTSYCESTKSFHKRRVTNVFVRPVSDRLIRLWIQGRPLLCTPNHPILTRRGWSEAQNIDISDEVIIYANRTQKAVSRLQESFDTTRFTCYPMPHVCEQSSQANADEQMHMVRCFSNSYGTASARTTSSVRTRILLRSAQSTIGEAETIRGYNKNKSKVCLCADEDKQSHVQSRYSREDEGSPQPQRLELSLTGREREDNRAPAHTRRQTQSANGICDPNERSPRALPFFTQSLQGRSGRTRHKTSDRSGRTQPLNKKMEIPGSQKDSDTYFSRVDCIEVLQSAGDPEFGGLCPGGLVYNLEVEEFHTYIANGVVVHNCHHSPALTWAAILNRMQARYRYGFTATAWRKDKMEFVIWDVIGPIRAKVTREDVIDAGRIMWPTVEQIHTNYAYEIYDSSQWGAMITDLIADPERNALIEQVVISRMRPGTKALILTDRIEHANHLAERLKDFSPALLTGQLTKREREEAMARVRTGAALTVATIHLLGEGVDVPGWSILFLVSPFSTGPRVMQALGRVTRMSPGKESSLLIDFVDSKVPMLKGAAYGRSRLYKSKG